MQTPDATQAAAPTISETLSKLGTYDQTGLTDSEVQERLKNYGPNALVEKEKSAFAALLAYFWGPIPWMIEAAVLTALVLRHEDKE
jgi:H+-transporting ATPase